MSLQVHPPVSSLMEEQALAYKDENVVNVVKTITASDNDFMYDLLCFVPRGV